MTISNRSTENIEKVEVDTIMEIHIGRRCQDSKVYAKGKKSLRKLMKNIINDEPGILS